MCPLLGVKCGGAECGKYFQCMVKEIQSAPTRVQNILIYEMDEEIAKYYPLDNDD